MSISKVIKFTGFDSFYEKYRPLTPYGKAHKEALHFYTHAHELDQIHLITDALVDFIDNNEHQALQIENYLSRIDRLNGLDKKEYDAVDIQLIKKFLLLYKAIDKCLTKATKELLNFEYRLNDLLEALMPDKDLSESFFLSSAFDNNLKTVRNSIRQQDEKLDAIRQKILQDIEEKYQIAMDGRDFILVDNRRYELLEAQELNCEFYDSKLIKVKPFFGKDYLDAQMAKEQLLVKESELERKVLSTISKHIRQHQGELKNATETICLLDVSLARARFSCLHKLIAPNYKSTSIEIKGGFLYPLWEKHQKKRLEYTPLDATFKNNAILLSGSNMGGKTVLFKTVAFLQLLTQLGFRVPAQQFSTRLFDRIQVLGNGQTGNVEGLSSFGQEIHQLSTAIATTEKRLLLVDELARTTNAKEAKAILYAVLKYVTHHTNITGFFSTHFINMPAIEKVAKYRMKGLNKQAYENYCHQQLNDIDENIRLINAFMQYEVVPDDGQQSKDALSIAGMLGLPSEIMNYANDYLDQ
ncbi:MutS-related protein [Carboxylicivirga taeanensis]|uniref:lysine 5,6-aminomutase reactivase ATPase KamC n=1 Tax=Carboxylicivirga taeanensis TaxID=1416875 RepID=UPI003F6DC50F